MTNDIFDFLDEAPELPIEEQEPEKTSEYDVISILTYMNCLEVILANDGYFYGAYDCKMARDGKVYDNLTKIYLTDKGLPESKLNSVGVGLKVVSKKLSVRPYSLLKILSSHNNSILGAFEANKVIDLDNTSILRVLNSYLPKQKLYIKNNRRVGIVKDDEIQEEIQNFYVVSKTRAKDYMNTLEVTGQLDAFREEFAGGAVTEKPTKVKKAENEDLKY